MPVMKLKDAPPQPGAPASDKDLNSVMHVALPILGGTIIMGTDMLESMGHKIVVGNNTTINLECDTRKKHTNYSIHFPQVAVILCH